MRHLATERGGRRPGVGRFAVDAVAEEARRRGQARITVLWERGPGGPEGFHLRLGFLPIGELFGEVVGAKDNLRAHHAGESSCARP